MFKSLSLIVALSTVTSVSAQVEYTPVNASAESKVCVIAAQQGLSAARTEAQKHGIFISRFSQTLVCNGKDVREIAKQADQSINTLVENKVALIAKTLSAETELCIKAAKDGVASIALHGHKARSLRCNDMPVKEFVKQYGKTAI
ncbi:exonuclease III [Pseudoalteromonas sp. S16_S37]|uniref:exonuclease III n=1 Tax=Pseudoalteromonas sp. S16_S37 TaxID=2720228 RepID=UPI00168020C3|nr:exonuclease III [Pseudoalteromonas sp. S16_S37]MBD1583513.1 exonuclease III [Pseudoalteromonas sp. S16_S37]